MTDSTGFAAADAGNSAGVISGTPPSPWRKTRKWTPAEEVQAAKMLLGGASYAEIGGEFGITRNAVAGRVYRINPAMKQRPPRKRKSPVEKPVSTPVGKRLIAAAREASAIARGEAGYRPAPLPRPDAPAVRIDAFAEGYMGQTGRVSIYDLGEDQCKFPIDQPAPELVRYCGLARVHGSPYCEDHYRRVTRGD